MMSTRPTILYVITKSDIGGAQGNVLDLIKAFLSHYNILLAVGCAGPLVNDVESLGIPVYIIPSLTRSIHPVKDWKCVWDLVHLSRQVKPSIIHAHSSKAGTVARIAGKICGIPTVFTAHGWGFSPGTPRLRGFVALLIEKLLAPISSRIICVSESDRQQALNKGVGNKQILTTIRYGINEQSTQEPALLKQPARFIMVARFNEQKDQPTLIKALAHMPHLLVYVDFVGSGPSLQSCKQLAKDLGVWERVSFLGDRRDVPKLLAESQAFILSTHYEGLPISILEAMRAGLPIIGSSVNGIPEEVEHQSTGLLIPPRNVELLAQAIQILSDSPELRLSMGKASRKKFESQFTISHMTEQVDMLYKEVMLK